MIEILDKTEEYCKTVQNNFSNISVIKLKIWLLILLIDEKLGCKYNNWKYFTCIIIIGLNKNIFVRHLEFRYLKYITFYCYLVYIDVYAI